METPRLALFFGCPMSNPRLLSFSSDGWYTVHVFAYLKAFALYEQMFAHSAILYVLAKFKAKKQC
jgi:hypothetical protein